MAFKVVPFVAQVQQGGMQTAAAADQLSKLINAEEAAGWHYVRMENVEIHAHDPGDKGCLGLGCWGVRPPSTETYRFDMVVFQTAAVPAARAEASRQAGDEANPADAQTAREPRRTGISSRRAINPLGSRNAAATFLPPDSPRCMDCAFLMPRLNDEALCRKTGETVEVPISSNCADFTSASCEVR